MAARTKIEGWGREKRRDKEKQENGRVIRKKRIGEKHVSFFIIKYLVLMTGFVRSRELRRNSERIASQCRPE